MAKAGKVIAITGAGDGLGRALARRFAADGDTLVLLGRTYAKVKAVADELAATGSGPAPLAIACDVANPESVCAAFAEVAKVHPKLDVLINNAAIFEPFTLEKVSDEQVTSQLMINVAGPIFCSREALPLLRAGEGDTGGHIINVTSESIHLKMPMLWLYAGTKTALELVSDMWGAELEQDRVRVTVVRAGMMMDETKTGSTWPVDVAIRFAQENARIGIDIRTSPKSHYNSVTDVFRAVLDTPADLHIGLVTLSGDRR